MCFRLLKKLENSRDDQEIKGRELKMVVIEPVVTGEEDSSNEKIPVAKPVKDSTSSSTATNMEDDSLRGGDAGYTSDGFETASETEFNDEDGRKEGERGIEKSNESNDFKVATDDSLKNEEEEQCREQNLELEENKDEVIMCILFSMVLIICFFRWILNILWWNF